MFVASRKGLTGASPKKAVELPVFPASSGRFGPIGEFRMLSWKKSLLDLDAIRACVILLSMPKDEAFFSQGRGDRDEQRELLRASGRIR